MLGQMLSGLRQFTRIPGLFAKAPQWSGQSCDAQELLNQWWYYSVELTPGQIAQGIYPADLPMLPRIMLRRCQFAGLDCLDLGSMEGLIPVLMSRQGARKVTATDFNDHCAEKMAAVRDCYRAKFDFQRVGLLYDLDRTFPDKGYDLINLSGLLYHVFSPLLVLAAVRPLLKRNGLLLVSTNVIASDGYSMEFNNHGRIQSESNTFWYPTARLFDYMLRLMQLTPIDCAFVPHQAIANDSIANGGKYVFDKPSGYLSVVCRAADHVVADSGDSWMSNVAHESWEYVDRVDWKRAALQPKSTAGYTVSVESPKPDSRGRVDLFEAIHRQKPFTKTTNRHDSHTLWLDDVI